MLIALNKPYGIVSQFTEESPRWKTLATLGLPPRVFPIGRLDADSEGLLLLSDEPEWTDRLLNPRRGHVREYWVQVERIPDVGALESLARGVVIQGERTRPCRARRLDLAPELPPRDPPIRFRLNVPDCWISLELTEGRNRQVRRMTAAVGHPTLRLVRVRIGAFRAPDLAQGRWRILDDVDKKALLAS